MKNSAFRSLATIIGLMGISTSQMALSATSTISDIKNLEFMIHNLWILIAAALVFIMHLGFAALEAGAVQSKNHVNILFKNTAIISIGLLSYAVIGFSLMYPGENFAGAMIGFAGWGLNPREGAMTPAYNPAYTFYSDFIFQGMFAATAATIVSGSVAERIKLDSFLVFSVIFVSIFYPIVGMWKWGGGFLDTMKIPFYDFAGSSIVHSVGGWAALAGSIILGPRIGRFVKGKSINIGPSNSGLATIGAFLLWLGWFGFNGGSVLSADPAALSLVFVTTALGGAAGVLGSIVLTKTLTKKLDLMSALNGALAGLVSITAAADQISPADAVIIGAIGGIIVVLGGMLLNRIEIDDPVGAIPVHLFCGIWGTLAVGLFGNLASSTQIVSQTIGIGAIGLFSFGASYGLFKGLDAAMGLRVSRKIELEGLDYHEHSAGEKADISEDLLLDPSLAIESMN